MIGTQIELWDKHRNTELVTSIDDAEVETNRIIIYNNVYYSLYMRLAGRRIVYMESECTTLN